MDLDEWFLFDASQPHFFDFPLNHGAFGSFHRCVKKGVFTLSLPGFNMQICLALIQLKKQDTNLLQDH